MKELGKKIENECRQSRLLKLQANEHIIKKRATPEEYEQAMKIREEQQLHWDKFNFYKNLNRAIEKRR